MESSHLHTRGPAPRSVVIGLLLSLAGALACHSDAPSSTGPAPGSPSAAASAEVRRPLVTPSIGGSVLAVGERQVELAILENGQVFGLVYDAQGKALASAELPKVSVALRTKGGGHPNVQLAWDAAHACLTGRAQLEGALLAEPIDVSLELDGKPVTAALADYAILPFARFGGSVLAVGKFAVELVVQPDALLAYVLESTGRARAGSELTLTLKVGTGQLRAFVWDAARARYSLGLDGQLELATQPLELGLTAFAKTQRGAAQSLQALAKARVDAHGRLAPSPQLAVPAAQLDATLAAGAGARGKADASAKLAAPSLTVAAPKLALPKLEVKKSSSASAAASTATKPKAGAGAKASASFSFGKN